MRQGNKERVRVASEEFVTRIWRLFWKELDYVAEIYDHILSMSLEFREKNSAKERRKCRIFWYNLRSIALAVQLRLRTVYIDSRFKRKLCFYAVETIGFSLEEITSYFEFQTRTLWKHLLPRLQAREISSFTVNITWCQSVMELLSYASLELEPSMRASRINSLPDCCICMQISSGSA